MSCFSSCFGNSSNRNERNFNGQIRKIKVHNFDQVDHTITENSKMSPKMVKRLGNINRGEMTSFAVLAKEDIDLELSPDEVEELENCSSEYVKENQSFANLLKNLFSGGGRERKSKIEEGEIENDPTVQNGTLCGQNFEEIRQECLDNGELFTDPEFPPDDQSLFYSKDPPFAFEWKRASEISETACLIEGGASRFDINQGELGDCWLLAALANLTMNKKLLYQVVPLDQSFTEDYAGIFHFKFWRYGEWVDVVIDDYLPTRYGQLMFMHSDANNEFWTALLEKAYAKLHGSYEALKGGSTTEAMVDFTGGCTELYDLQSEDCPKDLMKMMLKAYDRHSMMGCSIEADPNITEARTDVGLVKGHAYSITKVVKAQIETPQASGEIPLIRIRNPWGNEAEWNGAWSDRSPEWQFIPDEEKENLGLTFEADGEFWMSYKDFSKYWTELEICNLSPDSLDDSPVKWEVASFEGSWIAGESAGGCRNYVETFASNPQFIITLEDPDDDDEDELCTCIVSLMQKGRRAMRDEGLDTLTIGFAIYHLKDPEGAPRPLDTEFIKYNRSCARSKVFINLREVSHRFKLPPGTYVIIPSTFKSDEEGDFLLRVFSEKPSNAEAAK